MTRTPWQRVRAGAGAVAAATAAIWIAAAPAPATAEEGRERSFKRVKVGDPPPGGRRITVQIDAAEQARIMAAQPAQPWPRGAAPGPALPDIDADEDRGWRASARHAWFWDAISPRRAAAAPGRLERAVAALSDAPPGAAARPPRLADMQRMADAWGREILAATVGSGVSPALALAVVSVESAGRPAAVSSAGAAGLMQLMPGTAARFGVSDRADPGQNVRGGVAYLDWLLARFDRDAVLALAGYNAGEGAVDRHDGVPPYAETRDYVPKVLAAWQVARGLCSPAPQLVSDPCVFRSGVQVARGE